MHDDDFTPEPLMLLSLSGPDRRSACGAVVRVLSVSSRAAASPQAVQSGSGFCVDSSSLQDLLGDLQDDDFVAFVTADEDIEQAQQMTDDVGGASTATDVLSMALPVTDAIKRVQGHLVVDQIDRSTLRRLVLPTAVRVSVLHTVLAEGALRVHPVLDALHHSRGPALLR